MTSFRDLINNEVYVLLIHQSASVTGILHGIDDSGIFVTENNNTIVFIPFANISYITYTFEDENSEETFNDFEETKEEC
jgi:hypothetical protein